MGQKRFRKRGIKGKEGPGSLRLRPSVHPAYARLLVVELRRRGFTDDDIFRETRLGWEQLLQDNRFISFEQFGRIVRRGLDLTGEGWLGLDVGRTMQVSAHGPVGYAAMASANIGEALSLIERFASLRVDIADFKVERTEGRVRLRLEDTTGWGELSEYVASTIHGTISLVLEAISGSPVPDATLSFELPRPAWAGEYESRLRGITPVFDASGYVLDMPAEFMETPCITADHAAHEQALHMCERAAAQRQGDDDLSQRVLDVLLERQGDYPSLTEMAKAVHMSNRTLIRRLKSQGTSYQTLLDDVRQELAVWYLKHTEMPVEAIAERLGYRDTSNFSRTCRRWFGVTPRELRDA